MFSKSQKKRANSKIESALKNKQVKTSHRKTFIHMVYSDKLRKDSWQWCFTFATNQHNQTFYC
jgi:ribosomal protein S20